MSEELLLVQCTVDEKITDSNNLSIFVHRGLPCMIFPQIASKEVADVRQGDYFGYVISFTCKGREPSQSLRSTLDDGHLLITAHLGAGRQ